MQQHFTSLVGGVAMGYTITTSRLETHGRRGVTEVSCITVLLYPFLALLAPDDSKVFASGFALGVIAAVYMHSSSLSHEAEKEVSTLLNSMSILYPLKRIGIYEDLLKIIYLVKSPIKFLPSPDSY